MEKQKNNRMDSKQTNMPVFPKKSGGYRTRTDHLKHAMLALYQMS